MPSIRTVVGASLLAATALVARAPSSHAQGVLVAPPGIFIDHRTRSGAFELYNPGNEPAEVAISLEFGYPVTDSTGRLSLKLVESPDASMPSAARWIEAFPRRLVLRPLERQTVRLLARPPAALADGEYWSRIIVETKGGTMQLETPADSGGITVGLKLQVRTVVALFYRKGAVATGVAVDGVRAGLDGDSVVVRARLTRTGAGAFLGTVHGVLADTAGKEVGGFATPVAVYYTLEPRFTIPAAALPPGPYVLRLTVDTQRDDVQRPSLLPIAAVHDSVALTVAPRAP